MDVESIIYNYSSTTHSNFAYNTPHLSSKGRQYFSYRHGEHYQQAIHRKYTQTWRIIPPKWAKNCVNANPIGVGSIIYKLNPIGVGSIIYKRT